MSNKTSDKNVANVEDDVKYVKEMLEIARIFFKAVKAETDYKNVDEIAFCNAIENILAERELKDKRIQELEEYISIAPNLDEMTATKYINIQREAYIRGKAEEQQRAEQIIYENYIPKQVVIDLIANETIDISGFECIAVEDLEKIIGG